MKVYLIPGLGFDQRIFHNLVLKGHQLTYLDWIEPQSGESFTDYSGRMALQIPEKDEPIALIGHSMGGMASQEIAAQRPIDKVVLISSIRSRQELPFHFKIFKPLRIQKIFSRSLAVNTVKYWGKRHGYTTQEEQELFKSMVGKQSNFYLKWALRELSSWQTPFVPDSTQILQLHGKGDRTFPLRQIQQPDVVLPEAGHFMVYRRPADISNLVQLFLNN